MSCENFRLCIKKLACVFNLIKNVLDFLWARRFNSLPFLVIDFTFQIILSSVSDIILSLNHFSNYLIIHSFRRKPTDSSCCSVLFEKMMLWVLLLGMLIKVIW